MAVTVEELEIKITGDAKDADAVIEATSKKLQELMKLKLEKAFGPAMAKLSGEFQKVKPQIDKVAEAYHGIDAEVKKVAAQTAEQARKEKAASDTALKSAYERVRAAEEELREKKRIAELAAKADYQSAYTPKEGSDRPRVIETPISKTASQITGIYGEAVKKAQALKSTYEEIGAKLSQFEESGRSAMSSVNARIEQQRKLLDGLREGYIGVSRAEGTDSTAAQKIEMQIYKAQDQLRKLTEQAQKAKDALEKAATPAEKVARAVSGVSKNTEKATKETRNYGKQVERTGHKSRGIFVRLGASIKSMLTVGLLYKAVGAIRRAISEATENIARGSERANKTLSSLSTSFLYAKNSVMAAFLPALEAITPVVTRVVDSLAGLFNLIGMITTRLFGASSSAVQAKKAQKDYAASIGQTGKAADKALLSIDELNKLEEPAQSAGGDGTQVQPGDMFEEIEIPAETIQFADQLRKKILGIRDAMLELGLDKVLQSGKDFFRSIYEQMQQYDFGGALSSALQSGFAFAMSTLHLGENIVFPIVEALNIPGIVFEGIKTLTSLFDNLKKVVDAITPGITNFVNIALVPIANWVGGKIRDGLQFIQTMLDKVGNWVSEHKEMFEHWSTSLGKLAGNLWKVVEPIADSIWEGFKTIIGKLVELFFDLVENVMAFIQPVIDATNTVFDWADSMGLVESTGKTVSDVINGIALSISGIIDILRGLLTFLTGIFTNDWGKTWEGIKTTFSGISDTILGIARQFLPGINKEWLGLKGVLDVDWKKTWEGLKTFFDDTIDGIITKFQEMKDRVLEALGILKRETNKTTSGKNYSGANPHPRQSLMKDYAAPFIAEVPHFATGAAVYGDTLAVVGDNYDAASNPEIIAPRSVIEQTFVSSLGPLVGAFHQDIMYLAQVMRDTGGVELSADGRSLFQLVRREADSFQRITGQSAFTF